MSKNVVVVLSILIGAGCTNDPSAQGPDAAPEDQTTDPLDVPEPTDDPPLAASAYGLGMTRGAGYDSRPNGMDLNDDFSYGDVGSDDKACDDNTGTGIQAEDVDGDGDVENQIYVRPSVGSDTSTCGGPDDACATVQYVIDNRLDQGAHEDYICLYTGDGVAANEQLLIGDIDGDPGTKTRPASGLEAFDFEYPSNPNVLMGADWDNDGEYPPYDPDDAAVFDGDEATNHNWFIELNSGGGANGTDRWEFAHFAINDYGNDPTVRSPDTFIGSWTTGNLGTALMNHVYQHDIEMFGINRGQERLSNAHFFQDGWSHEYNYHAIENMNCLECCGYVHRGSSGQESFYNRWRNITATYYCEDNPDEILFNGNSGTGWKIWGPRTGVEILYGNFDHDSAAYDTAEESCGGTGAAIVDNCQRDVYIRGNRFANFATGIRFAGGLERGCQTRNADNFEASYNEVVVDSEVCSGDFIAFNMSSSFDDPNLFLEDAIMHNNIAWDNSTAGDFGICLYHNNGVPTGGTGDPSTSTFAFVGNTCHSDDWADGPDHRIIWLDIEDDKPHNWVISSNIIAGGTDGERAFSTDAPMASLSADYNIFENAGDTSFVWEGTRYDTLPELAAASGTNANSKGEGQNECLVDFVSATDFHLAATDTCALDGGVPMSVYYSDDFDRDERPQGGQWDIGADEYVSGVGLETCEAEECDGPRPAAPNTLCEDDTIAGPTCARFGAGDCNWHIISC